MKREGSFKICLIIVISLRGDTVCNMRVQPQYIAYIVSHGIQCVYPILGQSYCGLYCVNNLVIIVGYHPVYAIYHHQILAVDWLKSHEMDQI